MIPETGMSVDTLLIAFRKLLEDYREGIFGDKPPVKAVVKPPALPPTTPTTPPSSVVLTAKEKEEDDALDKQIKAKEDLLSSTSPVVFAYQTKAAEFNKELTALSTVKHPNPTDKVAIISAGNFNHYEWTLFMII